MRRGHSATAPFSPARAYRGLGAVLLCLVPLLFPSPAAQAAEQSELKLWVVEASSEKREKKHFDPGLEAIRGVLEPLAHDTYRKVAVDKHQLADEGATRIQLTDTYTLVAAAPVSTTDGRVRMRMRILMKTTDTPPREIEALSTELVLRPDKPVLVRGLKVKGGTELLLVLAVSVPEENT